MVAVCTRRSAFPAFLLGAGLLFALALALLLPRPSAAGVLDSPQCRPQKAQQFLKRVNFVRRGMLDGRRNQRALDWRIQQYGHVQGFAVGERNPESAFSFARAIRFFGLPVTIHRAVAPALRCVERRIRATCRKAKDRYEPRALGGFRSENSYRGGEVSNHLFGIAIDIDPDRNPCCGCVDPWPEHPACRGDVESVFERTALPGCWVKAFERYGFYWLGHDPQLRDTMHFEFLGQPKRVVTR